MIMILQFSEKLFLIMDDSANFATIRALILELKIYWEVEMMPR